MSTDIQNTPPPPRREAPQNQTDQHPKEMGKQFQAGTQGGQDSDPQTQKRAADFAGRLSRATGIEDAAEEAQGIAGVQTNPSATQAARSDPAHIAQQVFKAIEAAPPQNPLMPLGEVRIPLAGQIPGLSEIMVSLQNGIMTVTVLPTATAALSAAVQSQIIAALTTTLQQRWPDRDLRVQFQQHTSSGQNREGFNPLIPGRGNR